MANMQSTNESTALRLATCLQDHVVTYPQLSEDEPGGYCAEVDRVMDEAAAELRRLHAENTTLQQGYDAARLEIEALRGRQCLHGISEPSGWMPIETAPKDGTLIVLGARNGVWLGKYLPLYGSGYRPENPWSSMLLNHDHMAERYTWPTHWMPLPPSPSSADEGGSNG